MSRNTKTRTYRRAALAATLAIIGGALALVGPAAGHTDSRSGAAAIATADPDSVSFTLEGCRNNGAILLPNQSGNFVCPNSAYTTGNLGKGWNELDLVPFRITAKAGTSAPATQTYAVGIALDNFDAGHPGYDVLSSDGAGGAPVLNTLLSDPSCTALTSTAQQTESPGEGGIDQTIYRILTISQAKSTTCVYDWYGRLALGSHLFPGSSLHANLLNQNLDSSGIGEKDVSIPVKEISPQELNKDMSATRNSDHVWDLTKGATPAQISFGNTCDASQSLSNDGVQITVTWTKEPANSTGPATIITHVYAKNPAARVITLNSLTDNIYAGNDQTTLIDSASAGPVDLPANTANILILTHSFVWNNPGASANDVATASYSDKVTGVPIPGTTTASASANVTTATELNQSATITDAESITGSGLKYSVDSVTPNIGSFNPAYTLGTKTTGTSWTSGSQSASNSVVFDKTVYATKGTIEPNGNLHDVATLTGSDGASATASADIPISVNTLATLTIDKTIPNILTGNETATFLFHVKSTNDVNAADVASQSIAFTAGQTHKTADVSNLAPGVYYVFEDAATGWNPHPNGVQVDVSGNACSGTASFTNTAELAAARVKKVTSPAGFEGNWQFKLYKGANLLETVTSSDGNFTNFTSTLGEGSYSIVETSQNGWTSDGGSAGCSFTINLPADGGKTFDCTFTNTYNPSVDITKTGDTLSKIGDLAHYTIKLDNTSSAGGAAGAPSLVCDISDPTINFSKTVTLAPGGSDTSNPTFTIPVGASDPFLNTATANCHYPNLATVVATDQSQWSTNLFQPSITVVKTGPTYSKVGDTATYNVTITDTSSSDSPDLVFDSFSDSKAGSKTPPASCNTLSANPAAANHSCSFSYTYTVQAGDADPLVNVATAHYHPTGFTNDITKSGQWSTDLLHPSFTLAKSCDAQPVAQGGNAAFTVTLHNTGDADLVIDPDEGASNTYSVAAGGTTTFGVTKPVPAGAASVSNTVNGTATLASKYGLSNVVSATAASASCSVAGRAKVIKTFSGLPPSGTQQVTFQLRSDASASAAGTTLESQTANLGNGGILNFTTNLAPGATYQMCEVLGPLGPGSTTSLGPPLYSVYNPSGDNSTVCTDFTVTAGQTKTFSIDNKPPPGGLAFTIGFWKNWSSCTGGGQKPTLDTTLLKMAQNGTPATLGLLVLNPLTQSASTVCKNAVNILSKSTLGGKKMSSDPLFNMAAQLLAADLNIGAGSGACVAAVSAINQAHALLTTYKFDGNGYTPKLTTADANLANSLATTLDKYNNNKLC